MHLCMELLTMIISLNHLEAIVFLCLAQLARLVGSWPFTTSKIWSKKGTIHKPVHTMHQWISQGKVQQLVMNDAVGYGAWDDGCALFYHGFWFLFDVPKCLGTPFHPRYLRCAEALVLCTYPQILDPCVRESSNFEQVLENAIVVIDEVRLNRDEVGKRMSSQHMPKVTFFGVVICGRGKMYSRWRSISWPSLDPW